MDDSDFVGRDRQIMYALIPLIKDGDLSIVNPEQGTTLSRHKSGVTLKLYLSDLIVLKLRVRHQRHSQLYLLFLLLLL